MILTLNVTIVWDIAPCGLYVNRRIGGVYHIHLPDRKSAKLETACSEWVRATPEDGNIITVRTSDCLHVPVRIHRFGTNFVVLLHRRGLERIPAKWDYLLVVGWFCTATVVRENLYCATV
jgi:hypothetical protein